MARSDNPHDRVPGSPWPAVPIWLATLTPPSMALMQILLGYPLEHTLCATQSLLQVHVLSAVLLGLTVVAGLVSRREWRRYGAEAPGQGPPPHGTRRLMALLGMTGSVLFALVIVVQWLPVVMLPPCIRT